MLLQASGDLPQLVIHIGHDLFEFEDWNGGAHTGDDIFALRIHQELAVELIGASRRISRETHTCSAGVAKIAIDHRLHVDGCTEHVVDVVDTAIVLGAVVLPGTEHSVASHDELFARILREIALRVFLDNLLVFNDHFLQVLGGQIRIKLCLALFLLGIEHFVERGLFDVEHDIAEHLDQTTVRVGGKPRIVAARRQRLDALIVQTKVENRVHHSGHGELGPRSDAHQQRIFTGAEFLPLQRLQLRQRFVHLLVDFRGQSAAHVLAAGLGLNGEARRHGQSSVRHFGQPCAFAA